MSIKGHYDVKNFLDGVLHDFLAASGSELGPDVSRTTFSRAYTQLVITDAIRNAKVKLDEPTIQEGLDWNKQCLENLFGNASFLPDEIFDIDDAGKTEVMLKAIDYTKQRLSEGFKPS